MEATNYCNDVKGIKAECGNNLIRYKDLESGVSFELLHDDNGILLGYSDSYGREYVRKEANISIICKRDFQVDLSIFTNKELETYFHHIVDRHISGIDFTNSFLHYPDPSLGMMILSKQIQEINTILSSRGYIIENNKLCSIKDYINNMDSTTM